MSSLLNKSKMKEFLLQISQDTRGGKFTRVSPEILNRIEAKLRNIARQEVHSHPSVGCTLK